MSVGHPDEKRAGGGLSRRAVLALPAGAVLALAAGAARAAAADGLEEAAERLAGRAFGADWRDLWPAGAAEAAAGELPPAAGIRVLAAPAVPPFADTTRTVVEAPGAPPLRIDGGGFELAVAGAGPADATRLAFRGATVFDLAGPGQVFGAAARLLAIRVGDPRGEEFPVARAIRIALPAVAGGPVRIAVLVDGPSATAAARLALDPASPGTAEVEAVVFPRVEIPLGVAPVTATYLHAPGDGRPVDDWRPALHEAEGLSMWNGAGERLWRPLLNPPALQFSAFADRAPKAYALVQRNRGAERFLDPDAAFERRPSLAVEPLGDWGDGFVTLVEIPSRSMENDNVGVFWQPAAPAAPGLGHRFAWRLRATAEPRLDDASARIVSVRSGPAPAGDFEEARRYVVVHDLLPGAAAGPDPARARAAVRAEPATVEDVRVTDLGGGRVATAFTLRRPSGRAIDFRADLYFEEGNPGEVLLHRWP